MLHTVEAVLQSNGSLNFLEPVHLKGPQRVLVTFTQMQDEALSGAALSQSSLAIDWLKDEEEAAWKHLQDTAKVSGASN